MLMIIKFVESILRKVPVLQCGAWPVFAEATGGRVSNRVWQPDINNKPLKEKKLTHLRLPSLK